MALGRVIERPSVTDRDQGLSKALYITLIQKYGYLPGHTREKQKGKEREEERRGVREEEYVETEAAMHTTVDVAPPALCEQYKETGAQPQY